MREQVVKALRHLHMKLRTLVPLVAVVTAVGFTLAIGARTSQASAAPTAPPDYREYQNARWHFSIFIPDDVVANEYDQRSGQTIQFAGPQGKNHFQVSAWPYQDLDVALGDEAAAGNSSDQPDTLAIVHVFHDDLFEITFVKNGISYLVQTLPDNAASTLDILKSWEFI
jgi:hypothetical protein